MAKGNYYETSKEAEKRRFFEIRDIARRKEEAVKADVQAVANELQELKEVYDVEDKEGLAQWFVKDNRFQQVRQELMRAKRAYKKPYFGRIDFIDPNLDKKETYYIGKTVIYDDPAKPEVIDWRSPVSSVYYEQGLGNCKYFVPEVGVQELNLERKRTYEIDEEGIKDFYDSEVVANDELLTKYLSKSSRNVLSEIIATIQKEQNEVIRINPHHNVIVQGSAGSGKTTVAMHRISYILYNYELEFKPEDFYIVGSNKMLLNYITGVLPDLDVYDIKELTMEELFVRLLYEEWDKSFYTVRKLDKTDRSIGYKGSTSRFERLRNFCDRKILEQVTAEDVVIPENNHVILTGKKISQVLSEMKGRTYKDIAERLTDFLIGGLENELFGRGLSYPLETQKKLNTHFKSYFNRLYTKASVFDLYDEFMKEELENENLSRKIILTSYDRFNPDLYDLAALSYIYKALKETEVIREACHVVIDEAQDFSIFIYRALKYSLSKCTFTIMGDVSQNINLGCGLSDWEELKEVMLPNEYDYFGLLRKSYRNTIEISNYAVDILKHASFPIYPVEPIIRHGEPVLAKEAENTEDLVEKIISQAEKWQYEYETMALICKDSKEAEELYGRLCEVDTEVKIHKFDEENMSLETGITVLPIEYSKGLEFDTVMIADASDKNYPWEDGYIKLLYVAVTRALHELTVFYTGKLTEIIAAPIPENRVNIEFKEDGFHKKAIDFGPDMRTKKEKAIEQSSMGDRELMLRDKYGPKRNLANEPSAQLRSIKNTKSPFAPAPRVARVKTAIKNPVGVTAEEENKYNLKEPVPMSQKKVSSGKSEFGESPEMKELEPLGHAKIDTSVLWDSSDKKRISITSPYGILYLQPINEKCVRVSFARKETKISDKLPAEILSGPAPRFRVNKSPVMLELQMDKIIVQVNKKTGALTFLDSNKNLLLSESETTTRHFNEQSGMWWNYLDFKKKEKLKVCSAEGDWLDVSQAARFISTGGKTSTVLMSDKGYKLVMAKEYKVLLNAIYDYTPFIRYEGAEVLDYFFCYH